MERGRGEHKYELDGARLVIWETALEDGAVAAAGQRLCGRDASGGIEPEGKKVECKKGREAGE